MSEKHKCYHEEKGKNFNELRGAKPDPVGCTCDVGTTGPALEIEKAEKEKKDTE
ncbi:MAG: hypothetical protein Q4E24_10405 [bacterium]|nr:hypothetical protein [bacterium]